MLRCVLILSATLGLVGASAFAQPQPDKKADAKSKDDAKGKPKDNPKSKTPLDKLKLPKDSIIVVVDDWLEAAGLFPKLAVMGFDEWVALQEKIKALEQQLKTTKKTPFACKLHGRLEDDFLICRAEFVFSTEQPRTIVPLGFLGGHLLGLGELDGKTPILEASEDGFSVRVDKEGDHQLALQFRVPAQIKKSTTGGIERGVKLGLAETAVTVVSLELPANVKELRCNDALEKTKTPGRWLIGLEKSKGLNLAWKEPAPASGVAAPKAEGQINVRVDDKDANVSARLILQDTRLQTKEWRIATPPSAKVEVEAPPGGLTYELVPADGKGIYTLKTSEATAERWQVTVTWSVPRPNPGPRVPFGPLEVLGAQQTGTITVTMPQAVSFGQRLVFTRSEAVRQLKNGETEAVFEYTLDKNSKQPANMKAPLEVEWRFEKNQARTEVEHAIQLRAAPDGWQIDTTTRIKVTALFSAISAIDLKLPAPWPRGLPLAATAAPGMPFPGALPWPGIWKALGPPWAQAEAEEYALFEEGNVGSPRPVTRDATGKTRVLWERGPAKQATLILRNTYRLPPPSQRVRLEMPRPINVQDRGAKVSIQADERVELLDGPAGAEEAVPDRDHFEQSFEQAPTFIDLAWRPFQREIVAKSQIDIDLREHSAQVQQTLRFPRPRGSDVKNPTIELILPAGVDQVTASAGGQIAMVDSARHKAWLRPIAGEGDIDVVLQYDLAVKEKKLEVTPIWPALASRKDAKVRVWTPPGSDARISADTGRLGVWKERGIEGAPERKGFPALVLVGHAPALPLVLDIEESAASTLAAFLADRALIGVQIGPDGSQEVQARYFVRKLNADHLDIELPIPLSRFRDRPVFMLGRDLLGKWKILDAGEKVVRVRLHPDHAKLPAILEIAYTVPAEAIERSSFYRTTLYAPILRSEAVIGQMRWRLDLATAQIAAMPGRNVRADVQWGLQGWLPTPEAGVTTAELESWLTGKETAGQSSGPPGFAFWRVSNQPETVYHLPRQWWLLGCSGIFLIVTLGAYLAPWSRRVFGAIFAAIVIVFVVLALGWPAAYTPVLFGVQPGVGLFLIFIGAHWLLQVRSRRRLVFLPGFARAKPGSTMVRANSARRPREASTVDAPPGLATGSSAPSAGSQAGS